MTTTTERKLEALKQTNGNFCTYCTELQCSATNGQWNNPANCTALMMGLSNKIKNAVALSENICQQLQEFVAFLQWLDN
jgi:hypothetical protein